MSKVLLVGLDVHAETIAVALPIIGAEVRSLGVIPNRLESVRKPSDPESFAQRIIPMSDWPVMITITGPNLLERFSAEAI